MQKLITIITTMILLPICEIVKQRLNFIIHFYIFLTQIYYIKIVLVYYPDNIYLKSPSWYILFKVFKINEFCINMIKITRMSI